MRHCGLVTTQLFSFLIIFIIASSSRCLSQEFIAPASCTGSCPTSDSCVADAGSPPESNLDYCRYPSGCPGNYYASGNCCVSESTPIILDLTGEGFHLSNSFGGVWFRVFPPFHDLYMVAWPLPGIKNGWLALDRNHNGAIDDFTELFGNQTSQPTPKAGKHRNGFEALAVFDSPDEGGNSDGWISKEDRVFGELRVWVDANHDGISQPEELLTLAEAGVAKISLNYHQSRYVDSNGNVYRYRSLVRDLHGSETNKIIFDVYLQVGPTPPNSSQDSQPRNDGWPMSREVGFAPN